MGQSEDDTRLISKMKVSYDTISQDYSYPLSRNDLDTLRCMVSPSLLEVVGAVRFGCNTKTTQEGRTVQRGKQYEIRINFCLKNNQTKLLSDERSYQHTVQRFGGTIDKETGLITWFPAGARLYAFYLLLHEIGHVAYCERFKEGRLEGHGSPTEESWCDEFAAIGLKQLPGEEGRERK